MGASGVVNADAPNTLPMAAIATGTDGPFEEKPNTRSDMKIALMLAVLAVSGLPCVQAQAWAPQKNVELVVPVAPGGTNDKLARAIERTLLASKLVGTSVTVVHRAGGGNQIAYAYVSQHAGDPHYLLMGTSTLITAHAMGSSNV
jgi:putative tricarboxylic transport membrane protein